MPSSDERVRIVRRRLADGSVKEYRYSGTKERPDRVAPSSMGALILAFRRSPEWAALKPSTVKNYGYYLRDLEKLDDQPVGNVLRRTLLNMRDAIASERGNGAANVFIRVSSTIFAWAVDRGWIEHSPISRVRALQGGHLAAWTAAEADLASACLPEYLRRVIVLARYTGQRRGDLVAMTWSDYDGEYLRVLQQKGLRKGQAREPLMIRVLPELKTELDAWQKAMKSIHILTTAKGLPWKANHLTQTLALELPTYGLRDELNIHGLRKLAAATLANAGCSAHEIASITGHRSLAMVQLYTRSADQKRLADAAILKLENASGKRLKNALKKTGK